MPKPKRYPDNWQEIALSVKENAGWRCAKCHQQCLRPGKQSGLTKSERCALTLTVHPRNRIPEDNRLENLVALCTACHLSYHNRRESIALPGVMRYNKNRLKKYTNESIFSRFANKNSSSPSRSEAVDQKNSSDIFRQ
jgi:5-methylcytosine-specific restriction endonuclease McrA